MASDILPRLQAVAAETFGCDPAQIQDSTVADDIANWDSLRHLVFIGAVEQEFGVEFDMDAIAGLTNVADLKRLIGSLLA